MQKKDTFADLNLPEKPRSLILKRFIAFTIDILVIELIILTPFKNILISLIPVGDYTEMSSYIFSNPNVLSTVNLVFFAAGIIILLYFTIFEYRLRQTPGKMIMKLYVESEKLTFWQILISNISFIPVFPFILIWIFDLIYVLTSKSQQRFMEMITRISVTENGKEN